MNKKKEPPLPSQATALRGRIFNLEAKHANSYPDERPKLAKQIAEALTEYRELLPEIEAAAEELRAELKREWREVHRKREDLLRLLGQVPEPALTNAMGTPLGREPSFEKAFEYPLADLEHYGAPTARQPRLVSKQEAEAYRQMDNPEYWRSNA
jgi:hypothetical protein